MVKKKKYAKVDESLCVACGACVKVCPKQAISLAKGIVAKINLDKCIACSLCVKECPASVITIISNTSPVYQSNLVGHGGRLQGGLYEK